MKLIYGGSLLSVSFPIILHIIPNTCNTIMHSSQVYTQQWLSIKGAYPTPLIHKILMQMYTAFTHASQYVSGTATQKIYEMSLVCRTVKKMQNINTL